MKIGLVCPYNMFKFGGGVQELVLVLAKGYRERGHQVKIITPKPRKFDGDIPVDFILVGRSAKINTPFRTMVDVGMSVDTDTIDQILEAENFDILHFHEPWQPMLSRQILSRSKSVNVATFHAKVLETVVAKSITNVVMPYMRSVLSYIHEYTAVSEAASDFLLEIADVPLHFIPNSIDLGKYTNNTAKRDKDSILYIGRLEKRKGVKYLIDAFELLKMRRPNAELIIAGMGVMDRELIEHVENQNIDNVKFLGYISDDEKIRLLQSSAVFCSPALYGESFGIVLLEAMASGIPIVAGNNDGYRSVMIDEGRLSLVNPKDIELFADRLELMIYSAKYREAMLEWSNDYIKNFDNQIIVEKYLELYQNALKKHL